MQEKKEVIIVEVKPFLLGGGHIHLEHNGRNYARILQRYEYEYFTEDLKRLVFPHIDQDKSWKD